MRITIGRPFRPADEDQARPPPRIDAARSPDAPPNSTSGTIPAPSSVRAPLTTASPPGDGRYAPRVHPRPAHPAPERIAITPKRTHSPYPPGGSPTKLPDQQRHRVASTLDSTASKIIFHCPGHGRRGRHTLAGWLRHADLVGAREQPFPPRARSGPWPAWFRGGRRERRSRHAGGGVRGPRRRPLRGWPSVFGRVRRGIRRDRAGVEPKRQRPARAAHPRADHRVLRRPGDQDVRPSDDRVPGRTRASSHRAVLVPIFPFTWSDTMLFVVKRHGNSDLPTSF
jgi:hypothetical protein